MKKIPELVAPGGSYSKAMVATQYGADAVYLGVPFTSLRMRQNRVSDFAVIKKTINDLHDAGKKAFLTMNIFARNNDIKIFERIVEQISDSNPDAIIFGDPGTYKTIKKYLPNTPLHLSTQTNVLNYESVRFWYDLGVKRIVLARELNITEIQQIKKEIPEIELEVFVHGAMCIAYSGRCLLGEYFSGRDGNKGECSHVCRYKFKASLTEEKRPGKTFDLIQNEEGSYLLSSRDLCTIDYIDQISDIVDAVKIEGRSKGEFYLGSTVKAYRHVLDCVAKGVQPNDEIKQLVYQMPHRQYRSGFLFNKVSEGHPDGQSAGDESVSYASAGPEVSKEYFGLVSPSSITVQVDGRDTVVQKFVPKQIIYKGNKLEYFGKEKIGNITVLGLFDQSGNELEYVDCNTKGDIFVHTNQVLKGYEILYSDTVNFVKSVKTDSSCCGTCKS